MSAYNISELRSATDTNLPFSTRPEEFTTSQLRIDTMLQFGQLCRGIRIINNDSLANVTYRTQSPSAPLRTVPPSSDETIEGWTSYIEINPDPVSGDGIVEIDLVPMQYAKKSGIP